MTLWIWFAAGFVAMVSLIVSFAIGWTLGGKG